MFRQESMYCCDDVKYCHDANTTFLSAKLYYGDGRIHSDSPPLSLSAKLDGYQRTRLFWYAHDVLFHP